jgi:hypothetical protein
MYQDSLKLIDRELANIASGRSLDRLAEKYSLKRGSVELHPEADANLRERLLSKLEP